MTDTKTRATSMIPAGEADNSQFRQLQPSILKTSSTNTMTETETKTMTTKLQIQ